MCGTPVPSWTKSSAAGSGGREADAAGTDASAAGKREGAGSPSGRRASSPAGGRTENANRMMVSMECPHCDEFIWAELAKGAKRFVCPYCHKLVDLKDEGVSEDRATREGAGSSAAGTAGAAAAGAGAAGSGAGAGNGTGSGYAAGTGYGTATAAGYAAGTGAASAAGYGGGAAGGYVSTSGSAVAGRGAAGKVSYVRTAPPRRGRGKVIAAVIGGVAVVAVAAVLVLGGGLGAITGSGPSGGGEAQATYASNEEVPVSSGTAIVPLDDRDEPFASYTVRVKQADDADGRAIDIADMPNLDVQGTEGFTLGDLGTLDAGTYRLVIEDGASGASYDLPPLVLGGASQGGGEASRVTVRPPQDTSDPDELTAQGKYACFRDKLQGLVDTYGDASITVMKLDEQRFLAWAAGVAYAELVDFGDGAERLVVAYCTERDFASAEDVQARDDGEYGPRASDYTVEVWEYDEAADELSMMCRTTAAAGASDAPVVEYVENPDTGSTCLYVGGSDVNGSAGRSCFGLDDGGAFGELQAADTATWSVTGRFLLEHSGTSQQSATDDAGSGESSCTATAQTVKDLSAHLKTVAGAE